MASDAARGQAALEKSDYPSAITHLTAALDSTSGPTKSPLWLIQRSTAYQRSSQFEAALADAEAAVHSAMARGRREQIGTAHFRRAVSYYGLGQYGNARMCLTWTRKFNEKEKALGMWQAKVAADYDKAGEGAECNVVTAKEVPDARVIGEKVSGKKKIEKPDEKLGEKPVEKTADAKTPSAQVEKVAGATEAVPASKVTKNTDPAKVRTEWYQTANQVTIEIFHKGLKKTDVKVEFDVSSLLVTFPMEETSGPVYKYDASILSGNIEPEKSSFRVTPHKVEIVLAKSLPGEKWSKVYLEPSDVEASKPLETAPITLSSEPIDSQPPAPISKPAKNWDKVLKTEEDEDEGGDPMNSFFQKLYKDADPDTKRAMMKSYSESNGTALSTSWSDVGSKKVETSPPEGMEAKKWGA